MMTEYLHASSRMSGCRPRNRTHRFRAIALVAVLLATGVGAGLATGLVTTSPGAERTYPIEPDARRWLTGPAIFSDLDEGLSAARERVLVVLFLAASSDVEDHPVHRLVRRLIEARDRGADVVVVLDETFRDRNTTAFRQLEEAGIDVRWDETDRITHTKLVVADDLAWVGSANWTASALTGGNLESVVRVRDRALADRLYRLRLGHLDAAESRALAEAPAALLEEARAALAGPEGGTMRRNLAASGLDAELLVAAGVGAVAGDPARLRTRTLARLGVGTGWARWGLPPLHENLLFLPSRSGALLVADAASWTLINGQIGDMMPAPGLEELRRRLPRNQLPADAPFPPPPSR